MRYKRTLSALLIASIVSITIINVQAQSQCYDWYCVHRKDHHQPKADTTFDFIEDYNGFYIDKQHGDSCSDKVIYLTFDAGYENGNVEKILDVLKDEEVCAAFFVLGNLIEKNTELVIRMFDDGHLVGNHTFSHRSMIGKSYEEFKSELERLERSCIEKTGHELSAYYRPPEGKFDETTLKFADEMGYKTVFWSFAYADWDNNKQMSVNDAKRKILENSHNGEIMLLHPTSSTNAVILRDIIQTLKAEGYRFGSLDELGNTDNEAL